MTLAELQSFDVPAAWARLSPETQSNIGTVVIGWLLAELVYEDDGTETTHDDREEAGRLMNAALNAINPTIAAAFPEIQWWTE